MEEAVGGGEASDASVVVGNGPAGPPNDLHAALAAAERKVEKQKAHLAAAEAEVEAAKAAIANEGGE